VRAEKSPWHYFEFVAEILAARYRLSVTVSLLVRIQILGAVGPCCLIQFSPTKLEQYERPGCDVGGRIRCVCQNDGEYININVAWAWGLAEAAAAGLVCSWLLFYTIAHKSAP
jgi:hypothetical protein